MPGLPGNAPCGGSGPASTASTSAPSLPYITQSLTQCIHQCFWKHRPEKRLKNTTVMQLLQETCAYTEFQPLRHNTKTFPSVCALLLMPATCSLLLCLLFLFPPPLSLKRLLSSLGLDTVFLGLRVLGPLLLGPQSRQLHLLLLLLLLLLSRQLLLSFLRGERGKRREGRGGGIRGLFFAEE